MEQQSPRCGTRATAAFPNARFPRFRRAITGETPTRSGICRKRRARIRVHDIRWTKRVSIADRDQGSGFFPQSPCSCSVADAQEMLRAQPELEVVGLIFDADASEAQAMRNALEQATGREPRVRAILTSSERVPAQMLPCSR